VGVDWGNIATEVLGKKGVEGQKSSLAQIRKVRQCQRSSHSNRKRECWGEKSIEGEG